MIEVRVKKERQMKNSLWIDEGGHTLLGKAKG
jgi:hypothetical protein